MRSDLQNPSLRKLTKNRSVINNPIHQSLLKMLNKKLPVYTFSNPLLSLDCLLTFIDSKTVIDSIERGF